MKITFDTKNEEEVAEVLALIGGESKSKVGTEPKKQKPNPKPTQEKKEAVAPDIKLEDLKELAKNKVKTSGREKVKEIIAEYAPKLAEVKTEDYAELALKLEV